MISVKTLWQNQVTFGKCLVKKNATLNLETQALYIAGNGASRSRFVESLPPHQAVLMFAHDGDPAYIFAEREKLEELQVASAGGRLTTLSTDCAAKRVCAWRLCNRTIESEHYAWLSSVRRLILWTIAITHSMPTARKGNRYNSKSQRP